MTLGAIPETKVPREDELEREEKFTSARVIVVAIDHGINSHVAFSWALDQFVTHNDTVHLLHVLPKLSGGGDGSAIYDATQLLFDRLHKEAYDKCNVRIVTSIRTGDTGKEICAEAERTNAVAVIMGCRGLSMVKSLLVGSSTDYCVRHSPVPLIIVPHHVRCPEPSAPEVEVPEEKKLDGS